MHSILSASPRLHARREAGAHLGNLEPPSSLRALALSVALVTTSLSAAASDVTLFGGYQQIEGLIVDIDKLTIVGGQLDFANYFGTMPAAYRVLGEARLGSGSIKLAAGGPATLSFEQGFTVGGFNTNAPLDRFYFDVDPVFQQSFIVQNKAGSGPYVGGAGQIYQGELVLRNQVTFANRGTYAILNNNGIVSQGTGAQFTNTGTLVKWVPQNVVPGAANVSIIDVPFTQIGGNTTTFFGTLALKQGGTSTNSMFVTQGLESGKISFGGDNIFQGAVGTRGMCRQVDYRTGCPYEQSDGAFELKVAGKITVENGARWEHIGTFNNSGTVIIAPGGVLKNHGNKNDGKFEGIGVVKGGGTLHNAGIGDPDAGDSYFYGEGGYFSGTIEAIPAAGTNPELRLSVLNGGTFEIKRGQTVEVGSFDNYGGLLRVDGTLKNVGGQLKLLGGELWGGGIVNGDGIRVGGGPGVANFNPGNSPGTMTINGDFELLPGGNLNLEIARDGNGQIVFDRVLAQSYFLDGQVNFLLGAGLTTSDVQGLQFFGHPDGQPFEVTYGENFAFGSIAGYEGSTLINDAGGLRIVALSVTAVPEPQAFALLLAGLGLVVAVANRRKAARP